MATHEIFCKKCQHYETLSRPPRPDDTCPACGSGVYVRRGKPPRPATHLFALLRSFVSLRGALFLLVYAVIGALPVGGIAGLAILVLLYLAALKLALRAMRVGKDGEIEFPEVSPEELFDFRALIPAAVYTVFFVWLPPLLLAAMVSGAFFFDLDDARAAPTKTQLSADQERARLEALREMETKLNAGSELDPALAAALKNAEATAAPYVAPSATDQQPAAQVKHAKKPVWLYGLGVLGVFLFLWSPMALVMYLRTASTFGFFLFPVGLRAIFTDLGGYAALCLFVLPTMGVRMFVDALSSLPFFLSPPLILIKAIAVFTAWGLTGLYVRSRAREFDLPVDDDDWTLITRFGASPPPAAATMPGVGARSGTPAAMPGVARPARQPLAPIPLDNVPAVVGTALPSSSPSPFDAYPPPHSPQPGQSGQPAALWPPAEAAPAPTPTPSALPPGMSGSGLELDLPPRKK